MKVEGSQAGHAPDYLGKHSEGHHNLKIGPECPKLLNKQGIFQLLRLKYRYSLLHCILFYGATLQDASVTAHGLIGHSNYTYYIIVILNKPAERELGKLGGSHEYYPQFFFLHKRIYIKQIRDVFSFSITPQKVQVRHCGTN